MACSGYHFSPTIGPPRAAPSSCTSVAGIALRDGRRLRKNRTYHDFVTFSRWKLPLQLKPRPFFVVSSDFLMAAHQIVCLVGGQYSCWPISRRAQSEIHKGQRGQVVFNIFTVGCFGCGPPRRWPGQRVFIAKDKRGTTKGFHSSEGGVSRSGEEGRTNKWNKFASRKPNKPRVSPN